MRIGDPIKTKESWEPIKLPVRPPEVTPSAKGRPVTISSNETEVKVLLQEIKAQNQHIIELLETLTRKT